MPGANRSLEQKHLTSCNLHKHVDRWRGNRPQCLSSAWLGQSGTPSHSGFNLLMQEVALHWKFPLQFETSRHEGKRNIVCQTTNCSMCDQSFPSGQLPGSVGAGELSVATVAGTGG